MRGRDQCGVVAPGKCSSVAGVKASLIAKQTIQHLQGPQGSLSSLSSLIGTISIPEDSTRLILK